MRLACRACPTPPTSPLFSLPGDDADRRRIEAAMRASVRTDDPYLTEIASHLIVAGGKRLRPVLGGRRGQVAGAARHRRRRAGRRRLRAGAPRFALPRRRDGRGRRPVAASTRSTPSGATCRRSSPATSCWPRRVGDRRRRSAPRSPGCWRARSAGCARARSRSCATPTTRRAPRPATSRRSRARPRRCSRTAARIGGIVAGFDRATIDALTEYGDALRHGVPDRRRRARHHRHRGSARQAGRPRHGRRACTRCPVLRTLAPAGRSAAELGDLLGKPLERRRAREGAGDRALERRGRERDRDRPRSTSTPPRRCATASRPHGHRRVARRPAGPARHRRRRSVDGFTRPGSRS